MELCESIPFTGCDTISSVLAIGKGASLKAYNQSRYFREQAHVFANPGVIIKTISEQITSAGEKALLHLYKGTDDDNMDSHRMFCQKLASSRFYIKPEVLLPTSAAAKYHSFRVFHQDRLWMGENLNATEWEWGIKNEKMQPTKTDLGCAPSELFSLIRCNCKTGCSKLRCSCRKHGLVCTPACGECWGLKCLNSLGPEMDEDIQ